jgi:hypothetical protein
MRGREPRPPRRIQLRRTKGWRKPADAVVVARPTRWGNPFTVDGCLAAGLADTTADARAICVLAYHAWLTGDTVPGAPDDGGARRRRILDELETLTGRDLACWCALDQPCHADVLLALANPSGDG